MMNRFDCELSSTGSISQTLSQIGGLLPMTVSTETSIIQYLVFASDEIFSKSVPILITVDPCSSAILRMELADSRNADDWKNHFECLSNNRIEAIYLVSDEGAGIRAGHAKVMNDKLRQSDTYHGIAHNLGSWVGRLETAAYAAIEKEYEENRKLKSAKSKDLHEKWQADYTHAIDLAEKAITLYDDFSYLYRCVISELNVFDNDSNLRGRQQAEEGVKIGLTLSNHSKVI
jgi:Transposase, Mutator family